MCFPRDSLAAHPPRLCTERGAAVRSAIHCGQRRRWKHSPNKVVLSSRDKSFFPLID